ncbi:hypothetical protein GCM10010468_76680 [Actinocorallia longicatena]|uniref:Phosphodiester glycosidase domain-containing protein n=1 Tax=Actinocorallia longicatena TaxID=111803 RepID=A0ABP6QMX1_9ACTN
MALVALVVSGCGTAGTARPAAQARAAKCTWFPANGFYHADVRKLPRHPRSAAFVRSIGSTGRLKADFGSGTWEGRPFGIPITKVAPGTPKVKVSFTYRSESDEGPYAIPKNAKVEGGRGAAGDRHVLAVDPAACVLYELFAAYPKAGGTWRAGSGAIFNLRSNRLRPAGWTSADAAGLSIAAPLVKYDETKRGSIDHVLRLTVPRVRNTYVWPARHRVGGATSASLPPLGTWLRLKSSVNLAKFPRSVRPILRALQVHGAIIADIGSAWYLSGTQDKRWNNDALRALGGVRGSDFEAVDAVRLRVSKNSGQVR